MSAKIENNFGREAAIICLGTYAITGQIDEKYQTLFDFNEFTKNVSQIDVQKYFILCNTTIKIEDRKFVHEKNETETSVFFEQNGNMNNNKYGTDQGIIHSLLQYEKDGKTWSYNKANDIIEKCKEEHKVIPKFYEKFTDEYKKIKNTVMNKYGFNEKDAIIVLTCIDNVAGACTYASLCNSIFDSFKNNQAEFEKAFGFPMYKTENGKKVLNSELLLIDLYIYANTTKNGGKFFVQNQDGTYQVDKTMLDSKTDPLGGNILKTDEQIYIYKVYGLNENQVVQKYLEEKGIKINTKLLKFDYENISYKEMKKIINDIKQGMSNEKVYDLGIFKGINMIASTENKYPSITIGGGHEIHITDISENGFVVSSLGQKYLIPFSDLINNNDWVLVENTITPKQPTINIVDSIDSNYILKNYNEESFLSSLLRIIKSDNISELSLKEKTLFIMCQKRAFEGKINYSELFKNLAKLDGTPFTNEISTAYYDKVLNQIKFTSEEKKLILKNRDKNKYLVEYIKEKGQLYENLTSTELLQADEIIYGLEENILDKNLLTREDYQKIFGTDFRSIANALYKDNFTFDELINLAKTNPTISKIVVDNMGIYFLADSLETNILVNGEIKTILDYAIETGKITKIFHSNLGKILDDNATKYPKLAKYLVDRSVYPNSIFENLNMNVGENQTLLEYIIEKGSIGVILNHSKLSLDDITKSVINNPKIVKMLIDNGNISSTLANYLNMNVGENGQSQTLLEYLIATGKKGRLIDILKNSDKNKLQEMIENNPKIAELMISNKLTSYLWDINNISISPNGRLNDFMNKYKISKKTLINKAFEYIENGNENLTLDPLLTTDLTIELIKNEFSINELRNILLEEIIDKEQRVLIEKTVQLLQREKLNTDDILYQLKKYALTKKFDSNLEAKLGDSYTNIKENISRQNILMYLKIMNNNISNLNVNIPRNINNIIDDINSISGRNNGVDSLINYIHTGNVELIPDQNGLREEILKLGQQAIQEALIKETIGIDAKNKIDNVINIMTASSDKTTAIENLTIYRITGELIGADDDILQEIESLTENDFAVYFKVYDPTGELKKRLLKNNENNKNTNNKIIQTVNTIKDCISNLKTASKQDYLGAIQQLEQNGVQEKEIIRQLAEIAAHINNRDIQSAMFGFLKRKYPHESDIDTANLVCKYIKNELAKRPRKIKYTDPSTGIKVYAYEDSDPNFVDQCLQAIKTILARVPLLSSEKYYSEITIQDIFNPYDEYWRIKYGYATDFISAATGGDGTVNYYNTTLITHNKEQALEIHLHEIGHNFSKHFTTYVISQSPLWKDAMAADEKINGLTGISTYATETNSSEEDFADSFAYFLMDPSRLNKFPNRKKVLEKLLNGKVKRRKWYERF